MTEPAIRVKEFLTLNLSYDLRISVLKVACQDVKVCLSDFPNSGFLALVGCKIARQFQI